MCVARFPEPLGGVGRDIVSTILLCAPSVSCAHLGEVELDGRQPQWLDTHAQ
jgi:hypothetical protein